jgi:methyl coenzyme M reductase gamma subunit
MTEIVSFRNVGVIEVASTGVSFRFELNGVMYYVNRKKLLDVDAGKRSYTEVYVLEKPDDSDISKGDPLEPKSLEIDQIRNRVMQINAET